MLNRLREHIVFPMILQFHYLWSVKTLQPGLPTVTESICQSLESQKDICTEK